MFAVEDDAAQAGSWLEDLPRKVRQAWGAWPSWFIGKREPTLRRMARRRLYQIAADFGDSEFGRTALAAARLDDRRGDPHAWIGDVLRISAGALKGHRPGRDHWQVRKQALLLLDFPLHVRSGAAWGRHVGRFYQDFMGPAIRDIAASRVSHGLHVWKMYNMGFVVKSRRYCVGFDIHPGWKLHDPLSDRQMKKLADVLDVAMVSHSHWDHLNKGFLKLMLQAGKKVLIPETLWPRLKHPNVLRVYNGHRRPVRVGDMEIMCYPGWQRLLSRNCVYVVRMDGHCVAHNGDNTRQRLYPYLAQREEIDVLLANCWANMGAASAHTPARLLVTGHENELAHLVGMRAGFRDTYDKIQRINSRRERPHTPDDCAILTWGEGLLWRPDHGISQPDAAG